MQWSNIILIVLKIAKTLSDTCRKYHYYIQITETKTLKNLSTLVMQKQQFTEIANYLLSQIICVIFVLLNINEICWHFEICNIKINYFIRLFHTN
jgi:predicted ferric reductase